jgi:hypothetical protein
MPARAAFPSSLTSSMALEARESIVNRDSTEYPLRQVRRSVQTDPKIGPQLGARQRAQAVTGGMGQAAWVSPVPSGWGSGMRHRGHFEAEGSELADVVSDLPADVALALVIVSAEILIPHAGVGQQLVVDLQLGVADGDLGFGLAAAAGQPPVAGGQDGG